MEERNPAKGLEKIKSKMVSSPPPSRKPHRTHQLRLKTSPPRQPNPGMEAKNGPQVEEEEEEDQVEDPKMETPTHLASQGPGGTETAPLTEEETPPTTTESQPKATEPAGDEGGSSTGVAVVTGAPTRPAPDLLVAAGAEWAAGVAETTEHRSVEATIRNPRLMELEAGTVRTGLSITRPGPETAVKPAARVQSTKKSPRGGGRGAQRPAVRAEAVIWGIQTKKTTRSPTPRTALRTPTPLPPQTSHLHHLEAPRPGSSPPGVCPPGGAGVGEVEEETSTGAVATWEDQLEDTGLDPTQCLTVGPPSPQLQPGNSKVLLRALGPKTRVGEGTQERRRTRQLMEVNLRTRGRTPPSRLYLLPPLLPSAPLRTEEL